MRVELCDSSPVHSFSLLLLLMKISILSCCGVTSCESGKAMVAAHSKIQINGENIVWASAQFKCLV